VFVEMELTVVVGVCDLGTVVVGEPAGFGREQRRRDEDVRVFGRALIGALADDRRDTGAQRSQQLSVPLEQGRRVRLTGVSQ
jgi:hypothetical protein